MLSSQMKTVKTFFFAAFGSKLDSFLGQNHDQHRRLCGAQQRQVILGH